MAEDENAWRAQQESTSRSDSEEDEIKPGCYVLDINSTIICVKQIWIRVSAFMIRQIALPSLIGRRNIYGFMTTL
jgi:hypothetical protein